jgi:hypothetical protein
MPSHRPRPPHHSRRRLAQALGLALIPPLGACALTPAPGAGRAEPLAETIHAVTAAGELVRFNAGQPDRILARRSLSGLAPGESLLGIDYRVARGQLYGLGSLGRLLRIDPATGAATPVGTGIGLPLRGERFGMDFNPTVDLIRVTSDSGQNLRLHPETGLAMDGDPARPGVQEDLPLRFGDGQPRAGEVLRSLAVAYTYEKDNERQTRYFGLDTDGNLVTLGLLDASRPVNPASLRVSTVGRAFDGPIAQASMDIADVSNNAFAVITRPGERRSRWYRIDLGSGRATPLGAIGVDAPINGIAIEP